MTNTTTIARKSGLGGHVAGNGPSLAPAKRVGPATKSGVLQQRLDQEEARKAETAAIIRASASRRIAEAAPAVLTLDEEKELANAAVDAIDLEQAAPGNTDLSPSDPVEPTPVISEVVTPEELSAALAIIARCNKPQAEALRKAAAERKKVAPEGAKVKKVKELSEARKAKLAKAKLASEIYTIAASAAMGFVGKGLAESRKMQVALGLLSLPALRWLAKQYEGIAIPKDKRSAVDIREYLRVALLNWAPVSE
jgi:hypothetical protein